MQDGDWIPVQEWHRVVNMKDTPAAINVVTAGVETGGPKGSSIGVDAFVDWISRAGIKLDPVSYYPVSSTVVVVEEVATWPDNPEADPDAAPIKVATIFQLDGSRVSRAIRYDDLQAALAAAARQVADIARPTS